MESSYGNADLGSMNSSTAERVIFENQEPIIYGISESVAGKLGKPVDSLWKSLTIGIHHDQNLYPLTLKKQASGAMI